MGSGCGPQPGQCSLASLNLDAFDYGFLSAARYFCTAFSGDHSAWVTAVLNASAFFPCADSAETMRAALAVVQEMRTTRRSCFHFTNPRCAACAGRVTADERHLVQMVQHTRRGQTSRAASSAMLLCEGHDTAAVLAAAKAFCTHVPAQAAQVVH
ncbi:MAG: hypothetical protein AAF218_09830 [Pseudomonadota bacterium]